MKQLATIIAASFILFSCSESVDSVDKSLEVKSNDAEAQQNVASPQSPNESNINLNSADVNNSSPAADLGSTPTNVNSTPVNNQNISLPNANLSNPSLKPAVVASSAKGLNPAHGQPNHRCDIAVGEPLSTPIKQAPVQNITPAATQNAPQVITTPTLPKVSGAAAGAKLNPPHGEPGHDCAIQVGAPLNN